MNSSVAHVPSYTPDLTPTPEKGYPVMYRITIRRFTSAATCDDSIYEYESYSDAKRTFESQIELIHNLITGLDGHVEDIQDKTQFAYFSDATRALRVFVDYTLEYVTFSSITMPPNDHPITRSTIISLNYV